MDGTSCVVQENALGNFDVFCGTTLVTTLPVGGTGPQGPIGPQGPEGPQGLPGTAVDKGDPGEPCTGANVAPSATYPNGGVNITCANGVFFVANGAPGTGGPGGCAVTAETILATGDQGITLRCPPDQRSATIIICSGETPSTGLLLDDEGRVGQCKADGTISRTGAVQMLACGQAQFDAKKEFCQRTISTAGPNLGDWASTNTSGAVVKGNYPITLDGITNPESQYNSSNLQPGVNSVILPLCGSYPAVSDAQVLERHTGHVYNALQYCGRTLVVKIGEGTSRYSVSDGSTLNGKPVAGGALDNDPKSPSSPAWKVLAKGQCAIDLVSAETNALKKINGFNFTTTGTGFNSDMITRDCGWMEAGATTADPIYTYCPETADVVALDDVKCVNRTATTGGCIYHSTIDKTCLVQESDVSLYGTQKGTTAAAIKAKITAENRTGIGGAPLLPSEWTYTVSPVVGTGIKATPVGSRFGLGLKPNGALDNEGNLWSKACKTLTRVVYIAVNDPYLSNKGFKEDPTTASPKEVEGPLCEDLTPKSPTDASPKQPAIAFENAVACLDGTLSLDAKINGQSIGYDGTSWDKPLFCVRSGNSGYGLTAFCKVIAPTITDAESCQDIDGVKDEKSGTGVVAGIGSTQISWNGKACAVDITSLVTGTVDDQAACESLIGATRAQTDPLGGTGVVTAKWDATATVAPAPSDITGKAGGCIISSTVTETVAGATSSVLNEDRCKEIKQLTYGLNANIVPGTITGTWIAGGAAAHCDGDASKTSIGTCEAPAHCEGDASKTSIGTCEAPAHCEGDASKTSIVDCEAPAHCSDNSSDDRTTCETKDPGTITWVPQPGTWIPQPGTWVPQPGTWIPATLGKCKVTSSEEGAVSASNCSWINRAAASEPHAFPIPNATITWGAN